MIKKDTSPDMSFGVPVTGLEKNTLYRINHCLFDGMENLFEKDAARLICSLQGLINRDYETNGNILVYLSNDGVDEFWLDYITGEGRSFSGLAIKDINTFDEYLGIFGDIIKECGMVLWDENVAATANVAATVCGLDGFLPVKFDENEGSLYLKLKELGVPEKQSLVGLFGKDGSVDMGSGSAKCDAYLWAMDKYFDRCSSRYIAYILDGASCSRNNPCFHPENPSNVFENCIYNHDYYIARRCFFFDLTVYDKEAPIDDPNQPLGTDRETFKKILRRRYNRANGEIGQLLGFPPWWMKYTKDSGTGSVIATVLEWDCVCLGSAFNLAKEADAAHPCSMPNASAYCSYKSHIKEYHWPRPKERLKFDKNTKYFTIYGGDYDSAAWLRMHVWNFFSHKNARGTLPINWAFNPNLSERAPMVFDYVYENMTDNDFFIAGDSGAGYVIPYGLTAACDYRENPPAIFEWAKYSKPYYERFDYDITGFIINGNETVTNEILAAFNAISPKGSFHNSLARPITVYNGTPYLHLQNEVSGKPERIEASIPEMYRYMTEFMGKFNFAGYRTVCDSPDQTKELVERFIAYAKEHDPKYEYKYVDIHTFFDLVLQSGQGEIINE